MDVPKATCVAVPLDSGDVGPLLSAVPLQRSDPSSGEPEHIAQLSLACQLRCGVGAQR